MDWTCWFLHLSSFISSEIFSLGCHEEPFVRNALEFKTGHGWKYIHRCCYNAWKAWYFPISPPFHVASVGVCMHTCTWMQFRTPPAMLQCHAFVLLVFKCVLQYIVYCSLTVFLSLYSVKVPFPSMLSNVIMISKYILYLPSELLKRIWWPPVYYLVNITF